MSRSMFSIEGPGPAAEGKGGSPSSFAAADSAAPRPEEISLLADCAARRFKSSPACSWLHGLRESQGVNPRL
jgi:hypothetical protein